VRERNFFVEPSRKCVVLSILAHSFFRVVLVTAVVGWFNRPVTAADIAELSGNGGGVVQLGALAVAAALVTVGLVNLLS
jgi:hypothetical protein